MQARQNEINRLNWVLEALVRKQEWILKEIHHRVKNNLQIIISLLNSQSVCLKDRRSLAIEPLHDFSR